MISSRSQRSNHNLVATVLLPLAMVAGLVGATLVQPPAVAGPSSTVTGTIWADGNKNSTRESATEPGRAGVSVQLTDLAGVPVLSPVTTNASGVYAFNAVPNGTYRLMATAPNGFTFPVAATGTNDFSSSGPTTGATSAATPITIIQTTTTVSGWDGALQPTATLTVNPVAIPGTCNDLATTGVAPFDATDFDGKDSSANNCLVRSNDNVGQRYSVTMSNPSGAPVNNVYIEITLASSDGAVAAFNGALPTGCLTTGVTPPSGISGSVFRCNFGTLTSNSTVNVQAPVTSQANSNSPDGSKYHYVAKAQSTNGEAATSATLNGPDITVTDAVRWDMALVAGTPGSLTTVTINGVSQRGYLVGFSNQVNSGTPAYKGSRSFAGGFTFSNRLADYPGAILYSCAGNIQHVTPTGTVACNTGTRTRDPDGDWKFVVSGGPYAVNTTFGTTYFIPELDANQKKVPGWQPGDPYPTGTVPISNQLVETDNQIKGPSGEPNVILPATPGLEPGWNGSVASGNNVSNLNMTLTPPTIVINGAEAYFSPRGGSVNAAPFYPGLGIGERTTVSTNGTTRLANVNVCQVYDVSAMELMVLANGVPNVAGAAGYRFEYAIGPNDTNLGNVTTPPYGAQSLQNAADTCVSTPRTWATDPAAAFGPDWRDKVNMIRMRPINPATELPESSTLTINSYLRMRATYNGGPNAGEEIPTGTVIPFASGWSDPNDANGFKAIIDARDTSGGGVARWGQTNQTIITGAKTALNSYQPGDLVEYEILTRVEGTVPGDTLRQWTVSDTLDSRLTFDAACTQAGIPAGSGITVSYNPATRKVTYAFGDITTPLSFDEEFDPQVPAYRSNETRVKLCARLSATALPGATVPNTAVLTTPDATNSTVNLVKNFTVNAVGRLAIEKSVDHPLIGDDETVTWSIDWVNSNATLDLTAPDVLDVLPYNGDGSSAFQGTFTLTAFPALPKYTDQSIVDGTWYFATDPGSTINPDPTHPSNTVPAPSDPGGLWRTAAEIGPGAFASVTAVRFVHNGLLRATKAVHAEIKQTADSTVRNNKYFNTARVHSDTAGTGSVASNPSYVLMPGFTLGDRVWRDLDESGTFNAGDQALAGVPVEVFEVSSPGTIVASRVTDTNGRWFVEGLPSGTYRARIPATAFAPGAPPAVPAGPLAGSRVLTVTSDQGAGKNESLDNNNTATSDPASSGLTSTPATFSYTTSGGVITGGNGPAGDNTGGLGDRLIPDDFTDFTLDLSVVPPVSITIDKTADVSLVSNAGDRIRYSFLVTNTGGVTLNNVGVTDALVAPAGPAVTVTCPKTVLAAAEAMTCTASNYAATQDDIDNGTVDNEATVTGTSPSGNQVTDSDTLSVPAGAVPLIEVVKVADTDTAHLAGDVVRYTFQVTNAGNVTLTNIGVTDSFTAPATAPSGVTCPGGPLAPGATINCTMDPYTVSQADVNKGSVVNSATATGTPPSGPAVTSDPATFTVTIAADPKLTVEKSADVAEVFAAGETINYSFVVTNTGNVPLTEVTLTDEFTSAATPDLTPNCPAAVEPLAVGESVTCTASYVVKQGDIDAGTIDNEVTAAGTPPVGSAVEATDSMSVKATGRASISVTKTADNNAVLEPLDPTATVTYTVTVTNTGTLTVYDVVFDDQMAAPAGQLVFSSCPMHVDLAPGEQMTCTSDPYDVSNDDVDSGKIDNTVLATAKTPEDVEITDTDSVNIPVPENPAIEIIKTADVSGYSRPGTQITYTLRVINKGNVTLNPITVTDPGRTVTCPGGMPFSLAFGEAINCTVTYTTTQVDVNNGKIENTASVVGTPPSGPTDDVRDSSDNVEIPGTRSASFTFTKTATPTTVRNVGDDVVYDFVVTNTGNVTLTGVALEDHFVPSNAPLAVTCPQTTLDPQEAMTCSATYDVTLADVNAGEIDNTATVSATSPMGALPPIEKSAHVDVVSAAAISVTKSGTTTATRAGDLVNYTFDVTNTGNVSLTNVVIDDPMLASHTPAITVTCVDTDLDPNETTTCSAAPAYQVTQADVDAGEIDNTAKAKGKTLAGVDVQSVSSTWHVTIDDSPSITLVKSPKAGEPAPTKAGDTITYEFLVTNTGNTSLTDLRVDDAMLAAATPAVPVACSPTALAPGASITCTATYTVTQADVDSGEVNNAATATGSSPTRDVSATDDAPAVTIVAAPKVTLEKTAAPGTVDATDDVIDYRFRVTNDGNVTLHDVSIDDTPETPATAPTITCPTGDLAPGAFVDCTASYQVTLADMNHGKVVNSATATALDPQDAAIPDSDPSTATVTATQAPHLKVVKSGSTDTSTLNGQVTYDFTVTNDGNVSLTDVKVTDTFLAPASSTMTVSCDKTALDPTEQAHCTGSAPYVITQADVDNGSVDNSATATGTTLLDQDTTSTPSTWKVTMTRAPAIALVKAASVQVVHSVGDKIDYTFKVTNPGNVTLTGIKVTDQLAAPAGPALTVTCPRTSLAPAAEMTCTAPYKVTQADLDNKKIVNTATATADAQADEVPSRIQARAVVVSATDDVTVVVETNPAPTMTLVKKLDRITDVNNSGSDDVGDLMFWKFEVRNTGTVPIASVTINDPLLAENGIKVTCPDGGLDPGETKVCTSKPGYEITDEDAERGTVQNKASARAAYADGEAVYAVSSGSSTTKTAVLAPQVLVNTGLGAETTDDRSASVKLGAGIILLSLGLGWLLFIAVRRRRA